MKTEIIPIESRKIPDITGNVYGRLTVIGYVGIEKGYSLWLCRCSCGKEINTAARNLNSGQSNSCGCLQKERFLAATKGKTTTHGLSNKIPEYSIWKDMRKRCRNENHKSYHRYGGRGITVCERWSDFPAFLSDMGRRPSPKHTVERLDNDKDYSPENCIWATMTVQANNKSNSRSLTYKGKKLTVAQWARELKVNVQSLHRRVSLGWSDEKVLSEPFPKPEQKRSFDKYYTWSGESHTITEWARILNIKRTTLRMRLHNLKWTIEKAFTAPVMP